MSAAELHRLCPIDAIPEPGARGFSLHAAGGEAQLFVLRFQGEVRAYRNACPHRGIGLDWVPDQFFDADERLVQCSMHGALFEPLTGDCLYGPCVGARLERLPVVLRDGAVYLDRAALDDP